MQQESFTGNMVQDNSFKSYLDPINNLQNSFLHALFSIQYLQGIEFSLDDHLFK